LRIALCPLPPLTFRSETLWKLPHTEPSPLLAKATLFSPPLYGPSKDYVSHVSLNLKKQGMIRQQIGLAFGYTGFLLPTPGTVLWFRSLP